MADRAGDNIGEVLYRMHVAQPVDSGLNTVVLPEGEEDETVQESAAPLIPEWANEVHGEMAWGRRRFYLPV